VAGRLPPVLVVGWAGSTAPTRPFPLSHRDGRRQVRRPPRSECRRACGPPGADPFVASGLRTPSLLSIVAIARRRNNGGYYTIDQVGNITSAGNAPGYGTYQAESFAPVVGIVNVPAPTARGWSPPTGACSRTAPRCFYGSLGGVHLNAPIVGMAPTPSGHGYWLVGADGGVFAFGDAQFYMSLGGTALNAPIVGLAPTPSGHGYWLVGADGGVFTFAMLPSRGRSERRFSTRASSDRRRPHGGYWLVGADGGVFTFGGVPFEGSMGAKPLNAQVAGMAVPRRGTAIGWSARTGGSSPSATPTSSGRTRSRLGRNRRLRRSGVPSCAAARAAAGRLHTESHARRGPAAQRPRVCPSSRETTAGRRGEHVGVEPRSQRRTTARRRGSGRRVTGTGHVSGRRDQEDALTQRRLAADRLVLEVAGNELGSVQSPSRSVSSSSAWVDTGVQRGGGCRRSGRSAGGSFATRPTSSSAAPTAPSASTRGLCNRPVVGIESSWPAPMPVSNRSQRPARRTIAEHRLDAWLPVPVSSPVARSSRSRLG